MAVVGWSAALPGLQSTRSQGLRSRVINLVEIATTFSIDRSKQKGVTDETNYSVMRTLVLGPMSDELQLVVSTQHALTVIL